MNLDFKKYSTKGKILLLFLYTLAIVALTPIYIQLLNSVERSRENPIMSSEIKTVTDHKWPDVVFHLPEVSVSEFWVYGSLEWEVDLMSDEQINIKNNITFELESTYSNQNIKNVIIIKNLKRHNNDVSIFVKGFICRPNNTVITGFVPQIIRFATVGNDFKNGKFLSFLSNPDTNVGQLMTQTFSSGANSTVLASNGVYHVKLREISMSIESEGVYRNPVFNYYPIASVVYLDSHKELFYYMHNTQVYTIWPFTLMIQFEEGTIEDFVQQETLTLYSAVGQAGGYISPSLSIAGVIFLIIIKLSGNALLVVNDDEIHKKITETSVEEN